MNETGAAAKHITAALLDDVALSALVSTRIYADAAPEGAVYPFVVISHAGGNDRIVPGADARIMTRDRWLVKAVHNERSPALARKIAGLIDQALVGSTGSVTLDGQTYYISSLYRTSPIDNGGEVNGKYYVNSGGLYVVPVTTR